MNPTDPPSKQPNIPKPPGLHITRNEAGDELTIMLHWLNSKHITAGVIGLILSAIFLSSFDASSSCIALLPFGLIGYGLLGLINSTTIRLTPAMLTISHGPIPWPGNNQFRTATVNQLYIKKVAHQTKNGTTYTYDLYAITSQAQQQKLLSNIEAPQQAQYLELIIEQFLRIKDQPISDEWDLKTAIRDWLDLGDTFNLDVYIAADNLRARGDYRGYYLTLEAEQLYKTMKTRLTVTARHNHRSSPDALSPQQVESLFNLDQPELKPKNLSDQTTRRSSALHSKYVNIFQLPGQLDSVEPGRNLTYQQGGFIAARAMTLLIDKCCDLLDGYPAMIALGGEIVPILQNVSDQKKHLLRPIAQQWLRDIAAQTTRRFSQQTERFRCADCLTQLGPRAVKLGLLEKLTYYGCRLCGQSRRLIDAPNGVIAILDGQQIEEQHPKDGVARINWLAHRQLFDFDAVEIVQANDEEVERFAVQVGNDTDPLRTPKYPEMRCLISPECHLSKNTLRILARTFGNVATQE